MTGLRAARRPLGAIALAVTLLATLAGCTPADYRFGLTMVEDQLAVYVPTCGPDWTVEQLSLGLYRNTEGGMEYAGGWALELTDGPPAKLFAVGQPIPGYLETDDSTLDPAVKVQPNWDIAVQVVQVRQTDAGLEEAVAEAYLHVGTLERGSLFDDGKATTAAALDKAADGTCSGRLRD